MRVAEADPGQQVGDVGAVAGRLARRRCAAPARRCRTRCRWSSRRNSWNTTPIRRRISGRSLRCSSARSWPKISIRPRDGLLGQIDQLQQRRLARAGRPGEEMERAALQLEGHVLQHLGLAAVAHGDVLEADDWAAAAPADDAGAWRCGFLDMRAEIGDLEGGFARTSDSPRHDTDLSRVRHRLFRRGCADPAPADGRCAAPPAAPAGRRSPRRPLELVSTRRRGRRRRQAAPADAAAEAAPTHRPRSCRASSATAPQEERRMRQAAASRRRSGPAWRWW